MWIAIVIGAVFVLLLAGGKQTGGNRKSPGGSRVRIDHPHCISDDEYECGVCGARFRRALSVCPSCRTRFESTVVDEKEFDEEMDEEMDMDEEDGW